MAQVLLPGRTETSVTQETCSSHTSLHSQFPAPRPPSLLPNQNIPRASQITRLSTSAPPRQLLHSLFPSWSFPFPCQLPVKVLEGATFLIQMIKSQTRCHVSAMVPSVSAVQADHSQWVTAPWTPAGKDCLLTTGGHWVPWQHAYAWILSFSSPHS